MLVFNESNADRIVRMVLAVVLLAIFWYEDFSRAISITFLLISVALAFTAVTGSCTLYEPFNFHTNKKTSKLRLRRVIVSALIVGLLYVLIYTVKY